jgi:outer membrane protein OmpA-like peptidoglycan-associated protein
VRRLLVGALVAAIVASQACAGRAAPAGTLTPARDRITDEAVASDLALFDAWGMRLEVARSHSGLGADYAGASARAWLTWAREEYEDNDRGPVVEQAFAQARQSIERLEQGDLDREPGPAELVGPSRATHADLWAVADSAAQSPGLAERGGEVAELEVELLRASHEGGPSAACRAAPHLARAIELAGRLREAEMQEAPIPPRPEPDTTIVAPEPPSSPPQLPALTAAELDSVPSNAHFALNSAVISPKSADVLRRVAEVLRRHPDVNLRVTAHTDPRGSDGYNLALGNRRAVAIRDFLVSKGIAAERIATASAGKRELLGAGSTAQGLARERRVELEFTTLAGEVLRPQRQEGDLQVEK